MPSTVTVTGNEYRVGRLNARQQFHVARRIAPVIASISQVAREITPAATNGEMPDEPEQEQAEQQLDELAQNRLFAVIAEALSKMSDVDCDYVISTCMSAVQRRQGEHFMPVWNKNADQPQFGDIDLPTLMQLSWAVIQENLASFTPAQLSAGLQAVSPPSDRFN